MVAVNAIQGTLIADNAITAVHIATNAVSGTLIADNAVTATHIAQNTITVTQLADDCVESDKIADGVITTNHLNKAMISSQTEVTAVGGDFVLIGDTSDSNNLKKALVSDFGETNRLPLAGGTMTGDLILNDSVKLELGSASGGDLQIYHDGSDSYITDTGTGNLLIQYSDLYFSKDAGSTHSVVFRSTGRVGIGTTSPARDLVLATEGATNGFRIESADENLFFLGAAASSGGGVDNAYFAQYAGGSTAIQLQASGDSYLNGGKVGIGESSPARLLHVKSSDANVASFEGHQGEGLVISSGTNGRIDIIGYDDGASSYNELVIRAQGSVDQFTLKTDGSIHTQSIFVDTTTDNSVSNEEGIVLINSGAAVIRRAATMLYLHHTAGSGTGTLVAINKAQSTVGSITATNSNAAYNTSSDYRLKENVDYDWDATTRLKQLKPARFNWIADEENTLQDGFMAHEVENIVPEAVTGIKDAVWSAEEEANGEGIEGQVKGQQMDHSKLVPLLVKTVQELEARIKVLEG